MRTWELHAFRQSECDLTWLGDSICKPCNECYIRAVNKNPFCISSWLMAALLVIPQVGVLKLNLNNFQEWRSSVQIVDRMQKTWNQILIIMKLVYNGFDIQNLFLFKQSFASNADAIFRNCYGSPPWMYWLCNVPPFFYKNRQRLKFRYCVKF